jgi:three-Cys-motif partner protein
MATGTDGGLLDGPKPQSVYKHGILEQYVRPYATMTATPLKPRRAVLFDGFAGRGRFDSGEPASAEYMMRTAVAMKESTQIDIFLVERDEEDFIRLDAVADEFRGSGIEVRTRHGDCADHLDEVLSWSRSASLFLFLDPCGAILPFETLSTLLKRRPAWPRTELLMNFSADLIRRAAGQVKKGLVDQAGVAVTDRVCGSDWWREMALKAHRDSGSKDWEAAAEAVALEYARRLTAGTEFTARVAPVRRRIGQQPVYFLIFLTVDPHGLWMFGVSAARARELWLRFLGPDDEVLEGMLFSDVDHQITSDHNAAIVRIRQNIRTLLADGKARKAVEFAPDIFAGVWGEAKETAFSAALRQLVKDREVEVVEKAKHPRGNVLRRRRA